MPQPDAAVREVRHVHPGHERPEHGFAMRVRRTIEHLGTSNSVPAAC